MGLNAQTITGAACERIKADILSGKYKPGQHLLEKELCEELKVSRTPIRDALIRLEQEELVVSRPHKGVFVRKFTQRDIQDYYQTRTVLEGLGAELAASNITQEAKIKLKVILEEMKVCLKDGNGHKEIISINNQFHDYVFQLAGNEVLDKMRKTLAHPIALIRVTSWIDDARKLESLNEHEHIIEAIIQEDSQSAKERAKAHIVKAWKSAERNWHRLPGDEEGIT